MSGGEGETDDSSSVRPVVYEGRTAPVSVTLDGARERRRGGRGRQRRRDVELVVGGQGDDVLIGNNRTLNGFLGGRGNDVIRGEGGQVDALYGERGNDVLIGGQGVDGLFGGRGDDLLLGGSGDDFLDGGNGRDRVGGGTGADALAGGRGNDVLAGGPGGDTFQARDGMRDAIVGGPGWDEARVDRRDVVFRVEMVRRPGTALGSVGPGLTGRWPSVLRPARVG